jgi:hypothetical protein
VDRNGYFLPWKAQKTTLAAGRPFLAFVIFELGLFITLGHAP